MGNILDAPVKDKYVVRFERRADRDCQRKQVGITSDSSKARL